jgi:Ca2+-binding EF-hand superfamily protein
MRKLLAIGGCAATLLLLAVPAAAQDEGYTPSDSHIERKPKGPKPPEPIERKTFDRAVEKLFQLGDTDRDGRITLAEFNATIESRKGRAISQRFAEIDTDRNQQISLAEFSAWQRGLGSAALSDSATAAAAGTEGLVAEDIALDPGRDREDRLLARLITPLNAVVLAGANTDYDTGTSLAELTAYEGKRFDQFDRNKDGWLTPDETRALTPEDGILPPPGAPGTPPPRG